MLAVILLLMVCCAQAQPVFGPYQIADVDSGYVIQSFSAVAHHDTLEVLWGSFDFSEERSSVRWASFDMNQRELLSSPSTLALRDDWHWTVHRPVVVSPGVWSAGISGGDIHYYPNYHWSNEYGYFFLGDVGSELLTVRDGIAELLRFQNSNWPFMGCLGQEFLTDLVVVRSISERTFLAAIVNTCYSFNGGASEPQFWTRVYEFESSGDSLLSQTTLYGSPAPLYGPTDLSASEFSDSSVVILSGGDWGGQAWGLATFDSDTLNAAQSFICELPDPEHFQLGRTIGGQLLVQSDGFVFTADTTGDCQTLTMIPDWDANRDPYFHAGYGFAALKVRAGYLTLARIDTNGQEVQPPGVLYETDGTSYIVDADVTITDDGRVVCVWSEYSDWSEGPRVLKIAWVDWETYLDVPMQQPEAPVDFALTAFPNPFNANVTIRYALPSADEVALRVFDLQGRLVAILLDERASAGSHSLNWSPEGLASGVYFAQLTTSQSVRNSKLLYLE